MILKLILRVVLTHHSITLAATDTHLFGTNLSTQYAPGNPNGYPDKAQTDGVIGKATLSWNPSEDVMYYVTWSEGFRPGLLNQTCWQN